MKKPERVQTKPATTVRTLSSRELEATTGGAFPFIQTAMITTTPNG